MRLLGITAQSDATRTPAPNIYRAPVMRNAPPKGALPAPQERTGLAGMIETAGNLFIGDDLRKLIMHGQLSKGAAVDAGTMLLGGGVVKGVKGILKQGAKKLVRSEAEKAALMEAFHREVAMHRMAAQRAAAQAAPTHITFGGVTLPVDPRAMAERAARRQAHGGLGPEFDALFSTGQAGDKLDALLSRLGGQR